MSFLFDLQMWIALFTLSALEIVLGVDNLVFISIAVSKLPLERRSLARRFGLALACGTRILLLLSLVSLARMDDTHYGLFEFFGQEISIRDLILSGGGIFLIVKGVMEIHDAIFGYPDDPKQGRVIASFPLVIAQIAVIDIVFSLDSVITAVGIVSNIPIMVAAIILAVLVMIFAADKMGEIIERYPTVKMLALVFLLLVGVILIAEGFEIHIPRGYLYFAMAFSLVLETLNQLAQRKQMQGKSD